MPVNPFANATVGQGGAPPRGQKPKPQGDNPFAGAMVNQPKMLTEAAGGLPAEAGPDGVSPLSISTPENWDYKTAEFGLHGESLPEGAQGWTPYGQPFFGGGLKGKLKEYAWSLTKDVKPASEQEWDAIHGQWKDINKEQTGYMRAVETGEVEQDPWQTARNVGKVAGLAASTVSTWWKDLESSKITPLSMAAKGVGVGLQAIGDLFSIPAVGLEKTFSAGQGFVEAASEVSSPLPRLDENPFTKGLEATPLGLTYDFARVALSPDKGNWEKVGERIEAGWNAGRIYYASAFDQTLREEYIRRYQAGEDPDMLGMELSNRNIDIWGHEVNANLIEMGGQLIFDPLNAVGVFTKGAKLAKAIDAASDIGGITRDAAAMDALKVIGSATDDAKSLEAWGTVVESQKRAVQAIEEGKLLKQAWTPTALTVASRENAVTSIATDFIGSAAGSLIREGYNKEEFLEALKFGIKSISRDADDMQDGLKALSKLPNATRWLGDDALTTYKTLQNFLTNENGVTDFTRLEKLFSKQNDFAGFAEEAAKLTQAAAKSQFSTIADMEKAVSAVKEAAKTGAAVSAKTQELAKMYETVPAYAKLLSKVNDSKIGQVRQAINNTLGKFYFNYQGGVAAKNILSNNILMGIDDGLKSFAGFEEVVRDGKVLSRPKIWTDGAIAENMQSWFGDFKPAGVAGFETAQAAASGGGQATIFGKWMEKGEQTGAMRIFDSSVRETMKKLLKLEFLGDTKTLKAAGMNDADMRMFEKLFYLEKGNTQKVMETFRAYKAGKPGQETVEAWRTMDFLSKRDIDMLDETGLLDELHDLTRTAQTPDDIEAAFAKWRKTIGEYAQGAVNDTPGVSESNPALAAFGALSDAENTGLLEKGASAIFSTITEAADNAQKEYMSMLRTTIDGVLTNDAVPLAKRTDLANQRETLLKLLDRSGKETKGVSDSLVKAAWHYTDEIKGAKKGDWAMFWKKAGLEGQPPADLDQRKLLSELWKQTKERQSIIWNGHFDTAFRESEKLKTGLSAYMDTNALESQFSQAQWAVKKAQEYRKAVYENGALKIKPMDNILWMAKEYGIPSATEKGVPLDKGLLKVLNEYSGDASKVREAAKAADTVGEVEQAGEVTKTLSPKDFYNEGKPYLRYARKSNPLSDWNHAMFADYREGYFDRMPKDMSAYEFAPKLGDERVVRVEDLEDDIWRAFEKDVERGYWNGDSNDDFQNIINLFKDGELTKEKFLSFFSPEDIVDSAKAYDSILSTWLWDRVLEKKDIGALITPDGAIVFDESMIKKYGETAEEFSKVSQKSTRGIQVADELGAVQDVPPAKYTKLEDVPPEQALQAFEKWRMEKGRPEVKLSGFAIPPAHADGAMPSFARAWSENMRGTNHVLDRVKNNILQQWGRRVDSPLTPDVEKAIGDFARNASARVDEARVVAAKVGTEARNFTLLNYGQRTYADVSAAWIMPYHFWYSRQYKNWMTRLATSPEVVAGYAKYKDAMEKIHYDMPDFFKQNVDVSKALELVGIKTSHPLFMNLEAAMNPLYGLTGTDFNDREKRVDNFSSTLDDIGKFGPSVWAPIQIANALRLSMQGETDAAARWAGRLIPETKQIKELSAAWFGKNVELDPAVQLFAGGLDPYERNRVGRALAAMIGNPLPDGTVVTEEMTIEAGRSQEGPLWDQAIINATQLRAGKGGVNAMASYLFGVGFKGRTQEDVQIDEMSEQMSRLRALNAGGGLTPDQYKQGWEELAAQYPFMETVLLSRRGGEERDTAYAYNVLGRIAPGDSTALYKELGIQDLVSKFYEDKGDMSKWTATDKARMMSAALDIGATYKLPDNATQQEWNEVKGDYQNIQEEISKELGLGYTRDGNKITGRGVWDMVSTYYDLKDTDKEKAEAFKAQNPQIDEALGMLSEAKISDPLLAKYYASLDTIESYYAGKNRAQLAKKYGNDITQKQSEYFALGVDSKAKQKAYLRAHPELKAYWTEKSRLDAGMNESILRIAQTLPQAAPGAQLREDFTAENATQEMLAGLTQQQNVVSWQELGSYMSAPLKARVEEYWMNGGTGQLSNAAIKELDYLARRYDYYDADDLLRQAGFSIMHLRQQQPAMGGPAGPSSNPFSGAMTYP